MTRLAQWLGIKRYQADERYRAALHAFAERDLSSAQATLNDALDMLPGHAEYHAAQGFFAQSDKAYDRAESSYARALQLNPYEMLANYGRGMAAYRAKQWQLAAERFSTALAADPKRAETLYYLAMTQHRLGDNAEALNFMAAAAERFAKCDDQRERHCHSWMREFEKLVALQREQP